MRGGEITLLDHVTGCLEAGAMTALMGPSGANGIVSKRGEKPLTRRP